MKIKKRSTAVVLAIIGASLVAVNEASASDAVKTVKENPGMTIGAGAGLAVGGPPGMLIGAGLGTVADNVSNEIQRFTHRIRIRW